MQWYERGAHGDSPKTLLVGKYVPVNGDSADANDKKRRKVAAFDFVRAINFVIY